MHNEATRRILVVDDQVNWREALVSLLSIEERVIRAAANFEEASEEISKQTYDLIVLDVRLVNNDVFNVQGLELLQLAKSQPSAPKVIVITGYPESIREGVIAKYGGDALVLKVPPGSRFDSQGFQALVQRLLTASVSDHSSESQGVETGEL